MSTNISVTKTCIYCGKEFTAKTLTTKYCCHRCNSMDYKKRKREEKITAFVESKNKYTPEAISMTVAVQQKEFLSIDETATLLGASRRTIYRMIAKGVINTVKFGSRTIIKRATIDNLFI